MIVTNGSNVLEDIARMIREAKDEEDGLQHNGDFSTISCTSKTLVIHISAYVCFDDLPHNCE